MFLGNEPTKQDYLFLFSLLNYRVVQKKGTVLLSTSLGWPAVACCSRAETFSQLSPFSFAQTCSFQHTLVLLQQKFVL